MSSSRLRRTAKLAASAVAVLLLSVCCAKSQQATRTPSKKGTYRIAGRVVSALDGHPLSGTTVSLSEIRGGALEASVLAGEGGTFAFEELPAGKYSLSGQVRGFVQASYNQHEQFSTAIVTGAGIDTETLVLRLQPAAFLGGRVLDEVGEPVRGAQVTLYREGYETGKVEVKAVNNSQTDTLGDYSLSQFREGKYFIAVKAIPWYAVYPAPPDPDSPLLTGIDPALDVVYPLTFYGDGIKSDAAIPIVLKPGERFHADIHLAPVRAVKITFPSALGNQAGGYSTLRTPVFDGFDQVVVQIQQAADGGGEVVGLTPGLYQFETTDQAGNTSRLGALNLTQGSAAVGALGGEPEGSIALNLVEENGAKLPAQMGVMLRGAEPGIDQRQMIDGEGRATFKGLPPDDYHFLIFGSNHIWQTVRIDEGEKHLFQNHRLLAAGESATLTLAIAESAKAVEGLALHGGKPMAGAMIVLVPVDAIENTDLFRRDQSDLDGTFALPDVPAGRYIVVAIADGWKLEWGKVDVLARFLARGAAIEIPASEREPVHLPSPIIVQDR